MKKYLTVLMTALMLVASGVDGFAGKKQAENDYNLQKAYDVLKEENDEKKVLELVNEQLQLTPDNVEALVLHMSLTRRMKDYAQAMRDINHALKVNNPKKSGFFNSSLHRWKAGIYKIMGDKVNAAASYKKAYELAQKDDKEQLLSIAFDYAQALYMLEDYAGADVIYNKILERDETYLAAMIGLARNMIKRGECEEALKMLDKCQKYDADYSQTYRFKMLAYDKLGEANKAIDAATDWIQRDDNVDFNDILDVLKKRPAYTEASLKSLAKKGEDAMRFKLFLGLFYSITYQNAKAVKVYDEFEAEYGYVEEITTARAESYRNLGMYDRAISDIAKEIEKDSDWEPYARRGEYYRLSGNLDAAIADFTAAMEEAPKIQFNYYQRGWCYEMKGDRKKAMEDYNMGLEMNENYPYLHLMRGELRLLEGDKAGAEEDFTAILQQDTVTYNSCRHYALHFLGRDQEAEEWMEKVIADDPDDAGHYYDKACLYARMGRLEDAVNALKTAFEKGYRGFVHIRLDDDMDSIRELPEFKALVEEYEAKHAEYLKQFELSEPGKEEIITEVAVKRHPGGTFEIPCDINGLALQMLFDTGASDVTISSVEANFMFKNGYLSEKDIKGKRYYQIANGQLSEGTVITLHEVKIGDAVLRNVDASVVKNQQAPLLLGQSAMERFGTITIDNQNNKLIIKH